MLEFCKGRAKSWNLHETQARVMAETLWTPGWHRPIEVPKRLQPPDDHPQQIPPRGIKSQSRSCYAQLHLPLEEAPLAALTLTNVASTCVTPVARSPPWAPPANWLISAAGAPRRPRRRPHQPRAASWATGAPRQKSAARAADAQYGRPDSSTAAQQLPRLPPHPGLQATSTFSPYVADLASRARCTVDARQI